MSALWRNWSRTQQARVRGIVRPRSLEELQEALARAYAEGAPVRPVGTGHAWSDVALTSGYVLDTRRLDRRLGQGAGWIQVQGGMRTRALNDHLAPSGERVAGLAIYEGLTVAGMVATGTHGSDLTHGGLSDQVLELEVVRPDGELVRITREDGDAFRAAQVSLGALGVVHSLKLRCHPAVTMRTCDAFLPLEEGIARLGELTRAHHHLSAYWIPYSRKLWLYTADETDEPVDFRGPARARDRLRQYGTFHVISRLARAAVRLRPSLTPAVLGRGLDWLPRGSRVKTSRDAYHYLTTIPRLVDCEYAVPLVYAPDAYRALISLVRAYESRGSYPINMAVHARFVKGSGALLSPTNGEDVVCLEAATAPTRDTLGFYRELGERMRGEFGGRPHWGKWFDETPEVALSYGEKLDRFEAVRRLFDPDGRLLNDTLRALLPSAAAERAAM